MNWIILLFLFFTFLGVILSILFFFKQKGNRFANILLGLYTFLFAFELLNNCLRWSGDIYKPTFIHLNLAHFPLWTIYGPLVFIYVRGVVKNSRFKLYDLLFLAPTAVIVGMLFPFYRLSTEYKLKVVQESRIYDFAIFPSYAIWIVIGIMFFYGFFTYFTFWQNRRIGFRENKWLKSWAPILVSFLHLPFTYL